MWKLILVTLLMPQGTSIKDAELHETQIGKYPTEQACITAKMEYFEEHDHSMPVCVQEPKP